MCQKPYTHVIWDFNGTILDDVRLGITCTNQMLSERGLPIIPHEDAYREIFGFPIDEYYRRLGFDFQREDYDTVLAPQWVALYLAGEADCPMNPGVDKTLAAVADRGIPQILLSATKEEQLLAQLNRLGIAESFEEILGLDNIHARSKQAVAEAWMARHPEARPLFIGDSEHDADVAKAVGADCLLYTGGHQSAGRLDACGFPLIHAIEELLRYLR